MINYKKIKKSFLILTASSAVLLILPTMTSCSLFTTKLPNEVSNLHKYMNASSQIEWISKRTMSLKFVSENGLSGYGTGWIFSKNPTKTFSYYVATNLHVASFLQNQKKSYYSQSNNYSLITGMSYRSIEIGIVGKKSLNNVFTQGTTDAFASYENAGFHYIGYLPIVNTKIVYSGNQLFENSPFQTNDPYQVRGPYIENGAIDFALIECDFSYFISNQGYNENIMTNFLSSYDLNPTIFAKNPGENYNNLFIGGFPYDNEVLNPTNSLWGKAKYPIWVGLSNINLTGKTGGISLAVNPPATNRFFPPYEKVSLTNEINFVTDKYSSYRNISLQGLLNGIDIGGGSSGSMVVNQNNEVVGIYWGTYSLSNKTTAGGIDYFYSDKTYKISVQVDGKFSNSIIYGYNLLKSIQDDIGKENLQYPIWE